MLKEEMSCGNRSRARVCDTCRAAASTVYCRAHISYLCAGCDARIHAANQVVWRHERVWVCEACERAPAAITCKADAASLCTSCDADIHSANPLARRHHRVRILPITGCLVGPPATHLGEPVGPEPGRFMTHGAADEEIEEDETGSWFLLNSVKNKNQSNGFLFGGEVDEYLDLVEYNSCTENQFHDQQQQHYSVDQQETIDGTGSDSVVPVQCLEVEVKEQQLFKHQQHEMEYQPSKAGFCYTASISHSVSMSSMDAGVVPDSTMSDISNSHPRPPKGSIDLFSSPIPPQFTPMDREARVLRYREKRKTRKFEKTIRYASRKAYAETRPRIKGRFAKRTDIEVEVDQMFSTTVMVESVYGIVPSF
ncbi:hypothetical protein HHK36_032841 [Tetracentron sinense]|uniref:Uncharacterized protein n=1 Tax=Tetracentron sinense TaxID=13715 RepID=A0A834Y8J3_TETSI|nr:hypothetical protein HHK36_032841 [Tetracentron sinense]